MRTKKVRVMLLITMQLLVGLFLNAQELYVGANDHPHDNKNIDKIKSDIELMNATFGIGRIQFEGTNPFWCSESTTHNAVPNSIRKSAYATLMYGIQMLCGCTWQNMWDGVTNRKCNKNKQIDTELKKIKKYFPYNLDAEVGLAFSFHSQIASKYFLKLHENQLRTSLNVFFFHNKDSKILDISKCSLNYKLMLVPGVAVKDKTTADKIRRFEKDRGTIIMTSNSAIVDITGQVFVNTHPSRLSDIFGIGVGSYEET